MQTKEQELEENRDLQKQARKTWDSWLKEMSDKEQPNVCNLDDEECESCGS
tara:strand:- start:286 stop:438 length:153 start_codon:yes stop_codon:yes gene_type:complete